VPQLNQCIRTFTINMSARSYHASGSRRLLKRLQNLTGTTLTRSFAGSLMTSQELSRTNDFGMYSIANPSLPIPSIIMHAVLQCIRSHDEEMECVAKVKAHISTHVSRYLTRVQALISSRAMKGWELDMKALRALPAFPYEKTMNRSTAQAWLMIHGCIQYLPHTEDEGLQESVLRYVDAPLRAYYIELHSLQVLCLRS
jgi:hypothetical protein